MYNLEPLVCNEQQLCDFLQWKRFNAGIGHKALNVHIAAIKKYLERNNKFIVANSGSLSRARAIVRSERRLNPSGTGADTLTLEELKSLVKALDELELSTLERKAWRVVYTLAFFGLKRISEYAVQLKEGKNINIDQIRFQYTLWNENWEKSDTFSFNRRKGKTAQFGRDLYATYVCTDTKGICAVCEMKSYLKERMKISKPEELIKEELFPRTRNFNKYGIGRTIRETTKIAKVEGKISSHSLKKGGLQLAVDSGVPKNEIVRQADWASEQMIATYYRNANRKVSSKMWKRHL